MTDDRIPPGLERRIASSLQTAAPLPAPDLADRVLRQTASAPQRGRWGGLALASALAATAAIVAAVVIGLQLDGQLSPSPHVGSEPSVAAATPRPSASAAATSEGGSASPSPSNGGFPAGTTCTNEELGFTVSYPADWWANDAVAPEDPALTPIPACTYFAEEAVELQPNAGLPDGIAVVVDLAEAPAGQPTGVEVLEQRETEVDGRPAVVQELEWTEDTVFQQAGDRMYSYRIELADGETLLISTDTSVSGADEDTYTEHRDVLDRMMESLAFTAP